MQDDSLDKSYAQVLDGIVVGTRRVSNDWPKWFAETQGTFEERVASIFRTRGIVPGPLQFSNAQQQARIIAEQTPDVVEVPEEPQTTKRTTKKESDA